MKRITGMIALCTLSAAAFAAQTARFDGTWDVTLECPSHSDGAKGYTFRFPATVDNGVLHGQYGETDKPASVVLDGAINPDGSAQLHAHGRTGDPDYAVHRPASGSPYAYRVKARFDDARGSGERLDTRVCHLTFVKR